MFSTKAMLTVNSPLSLMNSLVPSRGSTRKKVDPKSGIRPLDAASSARTGMVGNWVDKPSRMISSAALSAAVTGDASAFRSTATPPARWAMISWPALTANCERASRISGRVPNSKSNSCDIINLSCPNHLTRPASGGCVSYKEIVLIGSPQRRFSGEH